MRILMGIEVYTHMAHILYDRVRETSTTTGTGTLTLLGAVIGYRAFSVVGNGNTCYYTIEDTNGNWEVGEGTYASSGTTLSRDLVYQSSNGGSLVNFTTGTKQVFMPAPAVLLNAMADGDLEITQTIWMPAGAMRPSSTGGCADLALIATSANRPDISTLDFDPGTEEYAQFWIAMPKGWDESTITAQFYWSHPATTTNFNVIWGLQGVGISNDDTINVAYGSAQEVTDGGGTTDDLYVSAATSAITIGGSPAEGDLIAFRVYRKAADGSDTLAVDARLHGVKILYNINTLNDA